VDMRRVSIVLAFALAVSACSSSHKAVEPLPTTTTTKTTVQCGNRCPPIKPHLVVVPNVVGMSFHKAVKVVATAHFVAVAPVGTR
jgi:hypothetical protein